MIILTEPTDTIQISLTGAVATNQLPCITSYRDITTTTYSPGRTVTNTNGSTPVTIVGSPAASTQRVVDFIRVYNNDTKLENVTITFDANGTGYSLITASLSTGESLEYVEGNGFKINSPLGELEVSINQGNNTCTGLEMVVLSADVATTSVALGSVIGLTFPVMSWKKYWFRFIIQYDASATATGGSSWSINGPTSNELNYKTQHSLTTTTDTFSTLNAYNMIGLNASAANTTGNIAVIEGVVRPTADGFITARFASEGATITAKLGSVVFYQELQC